MTDNLPRIIRTPGPLHAAARWQSMPLMVQLGNVGSEVERAIRAHKCGKKERFEQVLSRALELFDLTANDPRWRGHRRREVLRAREQVAARAAGPRT